MELLLKNGYVVDSANSFEGKADILIKDELIEKIAPEISPEGIEQVIDCEGLTVIPGICDMHVHLRDPGQTHKEDIITGGNAAVAGGVTAVACMPNTTPVVDNADTVKYILDKAKQSKVKVYPVGCITKGLKGDELCDFEELRKAGCVAVSDDGKHYTELAREEFAPEGPEDADGIRSFSVTLDERVRANWLKVEAATIDRLPQWHPGAGAKAFLFVDEVMVR